MGGSMRFQDALKARLDLITPSKGTVERCLKEHPPRLSPGKTCTVTNIVANHARYWWRYCSMTWVPSTEVSIPSVVWPNSSTYGSKLIILFFRTANSAWRAGWCCESRIFILYDTARCPYGSIDMAGEHSIIRDQINAFFFFKKIIRTINGRKQKLPYQYI